MELLDGLNEAQKRAVETIEGPVLVLAGPGSGKTKVLVHRAAYLIKVCGLSPYSIMAVTFTNKAAREMKERLYRLLGERVEQITVGTFHAICARILRREGEAIGIPSSFVIYDEEDQLSAVRQAVRELNLNEKLYRPPAFLQAISRLKAEIILPSDFSPSTYWEEVLRRVYERYQGILRSHNALDFDDLLLSVVRLWKKAPHVLEKYRRRFLQIMVDEFQDTNMVQYEILRELARIHRNLFVVGDEDQSIYRFRGADWRNVLRFREDFPDARIILLEKNYRSTQSILDAAQSIISHNPHRTPKKLYTERGKGLPIILYEAYDEAEEGEFVVREIKRLIAKKLYNLGDFAVMYRTNAQSRIVEEAFVRHNMPYKLVGAIRFYERKEIKDVLAYLRLILNPLDDISFQRVINVPPRGIGPQTVKTLQNIAFARALHLYEVLKLVRDDPRHLGFSPQVSRALIAFLELLEDLSRAADEMDILRLLDYTLERTGYGEYLQDGSQEGQERWENVQELRRAAEEYASFPPREGLSAFLEGVTLISDVDNLEEKTEVPVLLTLHMAKGLEFPVVFIIGMEEGLFPHIRSYGDVEEMMEERRLCYVGITRAMDRVYLVYTFRRSPYRGSSPSEPSRFIQEIPSYLLRYYSEDLELEEKKEAPSLVFSPTFKLGAKVRHPLFGEGVVVESVVKDGEEEVTVAFPGKGLKRFLVRIAKLELISE
ncbi:MAG: UvrD-helicase domain-containing protein [Anaerolineae bacterium]|nr:UvrD-helicase domain-containing protein [Anaerolineae bacterium]